MVSIHPPLYTDAGLTLPSLGTRLVRCASMRFLGYARVRLAPGPGYLC